MNIPLSTLKNALLSKTGARALSSISNLNSVLYEVVSTIRSNIDLPSSIRVEQLTQPLYTSPNAYILPDDCDLEALIQLRPVTKDALQQYYNMEYPSQFLVERRTNRLAVSHKDGKQYLLSSVATTSPVVIHSCEDNSTNGVWNAGGNVTNVAVDTLQKIQGAGSISFDVGLLTNNYIENTTMTSVDLDEYKAILFWVYLPSVPVALTSFTLRLGQDSSNYYSASVSQTFFGSALSEGWNLLSINKSSFAATGSPDWDGIVYSRFIIDGNFTSALSGVRLDSIIANIGELFEIEYYSTYQFVGNTGARKLIPDAASDSIILHDKEYPLFLRQFSEITGVDIRPASAGMEVSVYGGNSIQRMYQTFREKFPSRKMIQATDYGSGTTGYTGFGLLN